MQMQTLIVKMIAAPNEIAKAAKNVRNFALASDFSSREGVTVGSDSSANYLDIRRRLLDIRHRLPDIRRHLVLKKVSNLFS